MTEVSHTGVQTAKPKDDAELDDLADKVRAYKGIYVSIYILYMCVRAHTTSLTKSVPTKIARPRQLQLLPPPPPPPPLGVGLS